MHLEIWGNIHGEHPSTNKIRLLFLFLSVALEHQDSILLLLSAGNNTGSAFALMRPLIETSYRALWIYACASDEAVTAIETGKEPYPSFKAMADMVDEGCGLEGVVSRMKDAWKMLCGYAHTGLEQFGRRLIGDVIAPDYRIEEINEVIQVSTATTVVLAIACCRAVEHHKEADEIAQSYVQLFGN